MKKKKFSFILLCFLCFCVSSAFGFSTHNAAISRTFDKVEAVIGEYITVTVSFTNEEAYDLRGFYYTEQIPDGLSILKPMSFSRSEPTARCSKGLLGRPEARLLNLTR